jgi:hypothetical protein
LYLCSGQIAITVHNLQSELPNVTVLFSQVNKKRIPIKTRFLLLLF